MKRACFLFLAICLQLSAHSQEYLYEDFSGTQFPPSGWSTAPIGFHWVKSDSNHAGGLAPEACLVGFEQTGTTRFFSPQISFPGEDTVILTFKNFAVINDTTGLKIGVATRAQSIWEPVWEIELFHNYGPSDVDILITNQHVGQPYFQFCFYVTGELSSIDYWYIDDVHLYFPEIPDCKMQQILTPRQILGPVPTIGLVRNLGITTINEISVSFESYCGVVHDTILSGLNLDLFEYYVFAFGRKWVSPPGNNGLKMWINNVDGDPDGDQENDTLVKNIEFGYGEINRRPMFEEFTGNW